MNRNKSRFKRVYAEIFVQIGITEKLLDSVGHPALVFSLRQNFWQNSDRMNMLRTIIEGYAPSILIAMIGFSAIGGSLLSWLAFVWIFGAMFTVALGYVRTSVRQAPSMNTARIGQMEKC